MTSTLRGMVVAIMFVIIATYCLADDAVKSETSSLWTEPVDIASRDLFYGPGGPDHAPRYMEFRFLEEDTSGTNPKYNLVDADGVKWKMKLDEEARPETAASRLMWAAGYYANEEYFLASAYLKNLPDRLRQGRELIGPTGDVHHVRLRRLDTGKKVGIWEWRNAPFSGTREFNGLRTLMALLNNWDLKDDNNAIVQRTDGTPVYMVSDLGASFGSGSGPGITRLGSRGKGHLAAYRGSTFIKSTAPEELTFGAPKGPAALDVIAFPIFMRRQDRRWIGQDIPIQHARWIGEILGRLSPLQLRNAFKASGFSPEECDGFTTVVQERISALRTLTP